MSWSIDFISEDDFRKHVEETIGSYDKKLKPYDLKAFNANIIDPIKLLFDKNVYKESWEQLITSEIFRQRDKGGNNSIGYFHQYMFKYINGCTVPKNGKNGGWDVIYRPENPYSIDAENSAKVIYVEMKNKHNTMNSASQSDTYIKMQHQLLNDDSCCCFLVEAIAKAHQNIPWKAKIHNPNGTSQSVSHKRIRRVSLDEFYSIVTGEEDAFFQICLALPDVIADVVNNSADIKVPHDTVLEELHEKADQLNMPTEELSSIMALYLLGFPTYNGFRDYVK